MLIDEGTAAQTRRRLGRQFAGMPTSLMSEAVHDGPNLAKAGCGLASALEEAFIREDWPSGTVYAHESEICRQYGVGRRIFREAVRVLASRGVARIRRGADPALQVLPLDRPLIADMLRGYAYFRNASEVDHREAAKLLNSVATSLQPDGSSALATVLDFLLTLLRDGLVPGMPAQGLARDNFNKTRAGRIAHQFIEEYVAMRLVPGQRVASQQELSDRYCADRSIARQAIRLMESSGLFSSVPGRGNGVKAVEPPSGPTCRALCCYMASVHLPISPALDLFAAMSTEAIKLSAAHSTPADLDDLNALVRTWRPDYDLNLAMMVEVENLIFGAAHNPLIDLILRSVRGYITLKDDVTGTVVSKEMATRFLDATIITIEAIARGDAAEAARAHQRKLSMMREFAHH